MYPGTFSVEAAGQEVEPDRGGSLGESKRLELHVKCLILFLNLRGAGKVFNSRINLSNIFMMVSLAVEVGLRGRLGKVTGKEPRMRLRSELSRKDKDPRAEP